mmetsp:Transcript_22682/g.65336  ORF Transcript_22682/g.65336 Transcript_22682/m.65336 type:complete len:383 (+) Transcript_22682:99-1247(+)|eukprot:CAMPEP_0181023952 /NCGR_PEP_ID=MMETSP1070-20121207/2316_1 /TAXON_ID=265543 /ORGANISM="Minutocellus polymorphus, Strain NH13" /LENGTH=382 /DNA_ID=CAMNT_0023100983 /DNA_START=97 /DNA_END=1245 /DNA_ORIENTATION=+
MKTTIASLVALSAVAPSPSTLAFVPHVSHPGIRSTKPSSRSPALYSQEDEAAALLDKVRKMREEIASLENKSVDDVEREAKEKKSEQKERLQKMEQDRVIADSKRASSPRRMDDGKFLSVPLTAEDQVQQAARSVEDAFRDGITRQIVRFALLPEDKVLSEDIQWPGGAQEMYREAAGPLTKSLLSTVRAPTSSTTDLRTVYKPNVTAQDVWDFDGSAIVKAESATGPEDDVQALVLSNTDNKYTNDIREYGKVAGDRLFMLINPFWRNLDSWGINIMAPKAKQNAQEVIFEGGYQDTYNLLKKSARGEDCVALKAYPYDWQLYAFREDDSWPYGENVLWLGSTKEEPKSEEFTALLNEREEFKLSKNMRQLQRMRGGSDDS